MTTLRWEGPDVALTFRLDDGPVRVESIHPAAATIAAQTLVEVSAIGHGRSPGTYRHVGTDLGKALRYVSHEQTATTLRIVQADPATGLQVTTFFEASPGVTGFRTWTEARLTGPGELVLDFLSAAVLGTPDVDAVDLVAGDNNWMAESRWSRRPLRSAGVPEIRSAEHRPTSHARCAVTSHGSWSTGERLPTGVLVDRTAAFALGWQIEHNGQWHYELGETRAGGYVLLSGPTDQEHQWTARISAESGFRTVPVSVVVATGQDEAFGALTAQRRAIRQRRPIDDRLPVIFNDYMNTLMGDPTTEKLLPLIDAAAEAGAEYFCIDAGWYAEGDWWSTVGAWQPSTTRFPNGLGEVIDRIRARGMVPGVWLEPEVVGVDSPLATELPADAFISRGGVRVAEHGRHLLDLRSPAARAHLDSTVDRLIAEFGIGFFKLDYNTMTGPGTDLDGKSAGQGLLEHNRAQLAWIDGVQERHPELLLENCGSGALRMDYAMLSRFHLQSTSDQEDPGLYAPIAAAAPASVLPEQAGNWAYPQPGMTDEQRTFALVNGMLGRMYLSGHLNRMTAEELGAVAEAVTAHKKLLTELPHLTPFWPLGLPGWTDEWIALGLAGPNRSYLALWHRGSEAAEVVLPVAATTVTDYFPAAADGWAYRAGADGLTVSAPAGEPSARVIELTD
ncbi:alpha-galactosidase [Kribbella amoyensis]|uniref:Alpha-galactosidase n=1 Tax=Kribbella amoyensis TaxID=996641 RepID=A0A561BM37_9ACTN|nr:alpha-galactosidase [Kribbella amoyensis]TWD79919.1 alpha-galactosidase [Kribbella amoyensis]